MHISVYKPETQKPNLIDFGDAQKNPTPVTFH